MKKMKLWGLVSLGAAILAAAVLLAVGCENITTPVDTDGPNDGKLTIKVGGGNSASRAIIVDTAKNAVNFYEVIFYNGTEYTRTAWYKGQSARLAVPPADYDGTTNKAILLAGTNNAGTHGRDYTLLAVGELTQTKDNGVNNTPPTLITANTNWAEFTLYALEAAPSKDGTKSSFTIAAPAGYITGATVPLANVSGLKVPYFVLPKNVNTGKAEYKIPILETQAVGSDKLGDYVIFKSGNLTSGGVFSLEGGEVGVLLEEGADTAITNTAGTPLTNGTITMKMKTPDADGLSMLQIDATVRGMAAAVPDGIDWHIRGGLFNYLLDSINGGGTETNTTGGGILLAIGTVGGDGIEINAVPGVTVSPKTATFVAGVGGTKQFTANVHGAITTVTWTVTGGVASTISATGLLTVGTAETAGTLTVTATSTAYSTSGTATVTITP
jgi:hypothetical protein